MPLMGPSFANYNYHSLRGLLSTDTITEVRITRGESTDYTTVWLVLAYHDTA